MDNNTKWLILSAIPTFMVKGINGLVFIFASKIKSKIMNDFRNELFKPISNMERQNDIIKRRNK